MKRLRRVMAMLLTFVMVFSLIPGNNVLTARAAGEDGDGSEEAVVIKPAYSNAIFKDAEGSQYYIKYSDHWYKGEPVDLCFVKLTQDKLPEPKEEEESDEAYKARVKKALDGAAVADLSKIVDKTVEEGEEAPVAPVVKLSSLVMTPDLNSNSYSAAYKDYCYQYIINDTWLWVSIEKLKNVYSMNTDLEAEDKEMLTETTCNISVSWLDPFKFVEPKNVTYDLSNSYTAQLEEPTYSAVSAINPDDYVVSWDGWSSNASFDSTVSRNNSHEVSRTAYVYRLGEPDEDGNREKIGGYLQSKAFKYQDKTKYSYVKIADGEDIVENVYNETTGNYDTITSKSAYYLEYNPNIYNGDDFYFRYVRMKGDAESVTPSAENIYRTVYMSDEYPKLSQKNDKADIVLADIHDEYTGDGNIVYNTFVRRDADNDKVVYPEGKLTYSLTYSDDNVLNDYDVNEPFAVTTPIEFTLDWSLPGSFNVEETTKEVVFNDDDSLFLPSFTPDKEREDFTSYSARYTWYYTDEENGVWEDAYNHGEFYGDYASPSDNGFYKCVMTLSTQNYYDNNIYRVEQVYHASKVNVKPVGFIEKDDGSVRQDYNAGTIRTSVGQDVKIDPDVQTSSGYDISYQWYLNEAPLDGKKEATLSISKITAEQMGNYKLVASAKLSGKNEVCYKATYTVDVLDAPYTFDRADDWLWKSDNDNITVAYSVGEDIDKAIPLVIDKGYSASYQWYKCEYAAVSNEVAETIDTDKNNEYYGWKYLMHKYETDKDEKPLKDNNGNNKYFTVLYRFVPIEGQTEAGLKNYKVSENDFVVNLTYNKKKYSYLRSELNNDYYGADSYFYCDVTVKRENASENDTTYNFREYMQLNETYTVQPLHTPDCNEGFLAVAEGKDVTLVAPTYEITDYYAVQYRWEKGEPDEEDPEITKWKDVAVKKSDNTLKLESMNQAKTGDYRVVLSVVRADSDALVEDNVFDDDDYYGDNQRKIHYYTVSLDENEQVDYRVSDEVISIYRTTPADNKTKLGATVNLGVETEIDKNKAGNCTVTYQWYLNNEKIKGADKATYTIDSVNVLQFGEYRCKVTATNPDARHIPVYELEYEKDDKGNFIFDDYGEKIPVYEKNELGEYKYDENGEKIPVYAKDESGKKIIAKDESGAEIFDPDYRTASVFSDVFTVEEDAGITITTPKSGTSYISNKTVGDKLTLSVNAKADDGGVLTYTWYRRDVDTTSKTYDELVKIEGADKSSLELTLSENDFTTYTVRVSNSRGEETRSFIISDSNLSNLIQAKDGVTRFDKKLGESVDLTVTTLAETDGTTFEYVWYRQDGKIAGADKATYSISKITEETAGSYSCKVYSVNGSNKNWQKTIAFGVYVIPDEESTSTAFTRVEEYGEYENNEATNRIGDKVKFGVEPVEGNKEAYTYKWVFVDEQTYRDYETDKGTELLKQTTGVLTFDALTEAQCGYYRLTVYDKSGADIDVTDENGDQICMTYLVFKNPNNGDLIVNVEADEDTENGANHYIVKAKQGDNVTLKVNAESTNEGEITYQWYKDGNSIYGEISSTLELKDLKTTDFSTYSCIVTDADEISERVYIRVSRTANLQIQSDLIPITGGNKYEYNIVRGIGQDAEFNVNATADEGFTITYQWYKGGTLLQGETSNSLSVKNIKAQDYGNTAEGTAYRCVVKVALGDGTTETENVYFNLMEDDAFLNLISVNEDGDEVIETPTSDVWDDEGFIVKPATDTFVDNVYADAGATVTLKPIVRASKGYDIKYQWYHYDTVQQRYVKLNNASTDSYTVTVSEDEIADFDVDYRCEVSTTFRTVTYDVVLLPESAAATDTLAVEVDKELVYEGNDVNFTAVFDGDTTGLTYQWYTADAEGNVREIPNATANTYTAKAPIVARVEEGSNEAQADMEAVRYTCIVSRDGKIVDSASNGFNSIMVPKELDKIPEITIAKLKGTYNIQGYSVPGASSLTLKFSDDYKLGNSDAELQGILYVLEKNGNVTKYDTDEDTEVAGKEIVVQGDTVILLYECPVLGAAATVKQATALVNADHYGYKVTMSKDTAVYQKELSDAASAKAAEEATAVANAQAEADKKAQQESELKEALDTARALKNAADSTGKTTTNATTGAVTAGTLTVQQSEVIVAAGGTATVNYSALGSDGKASKVSVSGADSSVCNVSVDSETAITVSVPGGAKKGVTTSFKVTDGKNEVTVTVKVQNKTKKIKANKKTVSVKKGKSVTVKFKVTAENKAFAVTDNASAKLSKKLATISKATVGKGIVKVVVKGKKKGTTKLTVTLGEKKATVKVKVK